MSGNSCFPTTSLNDIIGVLFAQYVGKREYLEMPERIKEIPRKEFDEGLRTGDIVFRNGIYIYGEIQVVVGSNLNIDEILSRFEQRMEEKRKRYAHLKIIK